MKKGIAIVGVLMLMISCQEKPKKEQITTDLQEEKMENKQTFSKETLDEKMLDVQGNEISFQEIVQKNKGKKTVIEVWASWCPDCIKEIENFKKLQEENPNVNYVMISLDKTAEKWKSAIDKYELEANHYYLEQSMKDSFGTSIDLDWIPRYMVLDSEGEIILYKAVTPNELVEILKK